MGFFNLHTALELNLQGLGCGALSYQVLGFGQMAIVGDP